MSYRTILHDVESARPLMIGAVISIAAHLCVVPGAMRWLTESDGGPHDNPPRQARPRDPRAVPPQPSVKLGADVPEVSTVAWISHDDFRRLIAPRSKTDQPAVQQEIDPVVEAIRPPTEQTNPNPDTPQEIEPPVAEAPLSTLSSAVEASAGSAEATVSSNLSMQSTPPAPVAPSTPSDGPPTSKQPAAAASPASAPPTLAKQTLQGQHPSQAPAPTQSTDSLAHPANPLAPPPKPSDAPTSPRSDKDSDPFQLTQTPLDARLGGVITGRGIEIKPARPRLSIASQLSAIPDAPVVEIVFAPNGSVIEAKVVKSTGYPDIDGPLEASLYKWKAGGPLLEKLNRPVSISIRIMGL